MTGCLSTHEQEQIFKKQIYKLEEQAREHGVLADNYRRQADRLRHELEELISNGGKCNEKNYT